MALMKKKAPTKKLESKKPEYNRLFMSDRLLKSQLECQKKKLGSDKFSNEDKAKMKEYCAHLDNEMKLRKL